MKYTVEAAMRGHVILYVISPTEQAARSLVASLLARLRPVDGRELILREATMVRVSWRADHGRWKPAGVTPRRTAALTLLQGGG
jgi:hypothetical protein